VFPKYLDHYCREIVRATTSAVVKGFEEKTDRRTGGSTLPHRRRTAAELLYR
jgi:hypothetical protein